MMTPEQADKIINAVETGWRVIAVAVPTRALRVIVEDLNIKFRVEQLDPTANWSWRPVSTHAGDEAWESLGPAIHDMMIKQVRLKEKIKLARHNDQMAAIKAENPHGPQ
jgi:hypothetical protein